MMIPIRPLADRTVLLNVDSIERIEETPETVIVLVGGRRLVVVDLAGDLVGRIRRVRARVEKARSQGVSPEGEVVGLRGPPPASDGPTPEHAGSAHAVSSATNLHTGLIAFDRVLTAIARHGWAIRQHTPEAGDIARQQLQSACDTISELMRSIDLEHSGDVGSSLYDALAGCAARLSELDPERCGIPGPGHVATLRHVETTLSRLRRIWARIAADASRPASPSTDSSGPVREQPPTCSNSPPPGAAPRAGPTTSAPPTQPTATSRYRPPEAPGIRSGDTTPSDDHTDSRPV